MSNAPNTKPGTRSRRLIIRLSEEDDARIRANAGSAGLRLSEYIRRVAIEGKIVVNQQSGYGMAVAKEVRSVGVLLNQLTRDYHINAEYPPELGRACAKLEVIFDRIIRTS
jgi:hypothetical protein